MSEYSKIEWTDHTFNPWEGCQRVGPGCDHCYAETRNARFAGGTAINWGPGAPRRRTSPANWRKPLQWNRDGTFYALHGRRQRVFCASLADVFDNAVDPRWRLDLFDLIDATPNLDWLLLTKRIGNVAVMLEDVAARQFDLDRLHAPRARDNVWLGATVVNQAEADRDIPKLLAVPARVRFLSMEPLLGPVDLRFPTKTWAPDRCNHCCNGDRCDEPAHYARERCPFCRGTGRQKILDWVIAGGESGPGARPMHPEWARSLREQCAAADVSFLFKQWGEWVSVSEVAGPGEHFSFDDGATVRRTGKKLAGRTLDGVTHNGFPKATEGMRPRWYGS
ncbi:phage Gp37/Gp68 family protein [Caballeronia sp. LZ033]|uniref:phage Gp37/Gp68 family protein n=1 Tax=Caballeronia sp. LZ033 TaxID=3038566 RepID=UPI00285E348E|nr:phage Gp37/Gp68 family protein [Caballeronia sp. LZ033]MDR5813369.1 phage Gp37/Gp68 family protein [Caballeronia sp. LZ033]